ncbi:MAG TPA: type II toxin-antitoxin system HipA family toxin [Solirubrobacteraceae bacterium]|jgi:serine/threonine-protein kinase HipA|nr:type II toxin-antitoxin system HipA family toxin [Solirubrobacteraceae bacterium]
MEELVVYLSGARAGRLILKDNGNLQFRYDADYHGPVVSQSLPIQEAAHPHAVSRAVFGGLLLEGDARDALARNLGISSGNDYALLKELGGDCAGAVVLVGPDDGFPNFPQLRSLDAGKLDAVLRELPQRPLAADPREGIRLSLAGAQPKLPVVIEREDVALPLNVAAATTHIIKPEPARFPGLVDNEGFCMELARAVELPTARTSKRVTATGLPYLLVERYDRDVTAEPIRRLHQEDVCQALGRPSDCKYQAEGGPSIADTVALLRACSAVPAQDLPTLWRAIVFNWLIGNCDAHAKNFSLLYDAGAPTLAPLYDLVSTTVYEELTTRLAMTIDGARTIEDVTPDAWIALAAEVGYSTRFVRTATEVLTERVLEESGRLMAEPWHDNDSAKAVREGIVGRAS